MNSYILVYLKGIAMGAADLVPGVSGGTIAFISGIYNRLMLALSGITVARILAFFNPKTTAETWKTLDGNFLVCLFLGIGTSVLTLSKILTYLLDNQPIGIWSVFFGLILASTYLIGKTLNWSKIGTILPFLIGAGIAVFITLGRPLTIEPNYFTVIPAGFIAICAMLLPGISGSFILLLLNHYRFVLEANARKEYEVYGLFLIGCVAGLLTFSHIIKWLFKKYPQTVTALLTGFMLGSIGKIWPWKEVVETRINSHGEVVPFIDIPVSPSNYIGEPQILIAIIFAILGFLLVIGLEKLGEKKQQLNS